MRNKNRQKRRLDVKVREIDSLFFCFTFHLLHLQAYLRKLSAATPGTKVVPNLEYFLFITLFDLSHVLFTLL